MKRFLIILLVVLVVGGVVAGGYFLSKKNAPVVPAPPAGTLPPPAGTLPQGTTPEVTTTPPSSVTPTGTSGVSAGLSLVSSEKFVAFAVATSGIAFGVRPDGTIFSVSPQGTATTLSSSPIDSFVGASFSSDAKKVLAFWGGADSRQFSVFDIASSSWQPLPLNTVSGAWQPQSHTVAYLQSQVGAKVLYSWNLDKPKTKAVSLLTLHLEDVEMGYLSANKIYLTGKESGLVRNYFSVFDMTKKTLTPIFTEAYGLQTKWNSAGSVALAFFAGQNASGGTLRLTDQSGKTVNQLQLATLPEKCLFSADIFAAPAPVSTSTKVLPPPPPENFLYCAVPRNSTVFSLSLLPDDYLKFKLMTEDNIYRINTETGLIYQVFGDQGESLDAQNLKIVGKTLFFLNRYNQNLYALPIPKE